MPKEKWERVTLPVNYRGREEEWIVEHLDDGHRYRRNQVPFEGYVVERLVVPAGSGYGGSLRVRPSTYHDKSGFTVSGKEKKGDSFPVKIFFETRQQADEYVNGIKAGEDSEKLTNRIWGLDKPKAEKSKVVTGGIPIAVMDDNYLLAQHKHYSSLVHVPASCHISRSFGIRDRDEAVRQLHVWRKDIGHGIGADQTVHLITTDEGYALVRCSPDAGKWKGDLDDANVPWESELDNSPKITKQEASIAGERLSHYGLQKKKSQHRSKSAHHPVNTSIRGVR